MPSFSADIAHQLGQEQSIERLKLFLEKVQEKYKDQLSNLEGQWTDHVLNFSFSTFGFSIKGSIEALEEEVKLVGSLPFAAVAFRGKIEQSIKEQLEKVLA